MGLRSIATLSSTLMASWRHWKAMRVASGTLEAFGPGAAAQRNLGDSKPGKSPTSDRHSLLAASCHCSAHASSS